MNSLLVKHIAQHDFTYPTVTCIIHHTGITERLSLLNVSVCHPQLLEI